MDVRLKRLPVVKEFLDGQWQGGKEQILKDLQITDEERQAHLKQLYSQSPILKVEHLQTWYPLRKGVFSRVYGHVKAVDDVSLEVYEGETLGLVGESGCGKTTLGRSILRLVEPTGGKVWFDGIEVTALKGQALRDFRKQAQIVFQDPYSSLNPRITIGEAIAEPMQVHGIENDAGKEEIAMFHGVRVFENARQTKAIIATIFGSAAQPVLVNEYADEKVNLSNAHAVELFYSFGTGVVTPDLVKTLAALPVAE